MSIYEIVTDRILIQLAAGVIPWRKTWTTRLPKSLTSQKEYRGVNILVLGGTEYTSRYWLTYREAQRHGGHVRKGERATPVIYWKWRTPEELAKRAEETGKERISPCVPFVSAVFNLDQVDGVARPDDDIRHRPEDRLKVADEMLDVMPDKPEIVHTVTAQPAYSRSLDRVTLPHLSQFQSADEYYAALFHELVHSTGAPRRLNRFAETEGDRVEKYSFEELVAEFGAAFLCGFAGIQNAGTDALQASYIEGWARVFRQDSRILVRAASSAQAAADFVRGKLPARTGVTAPAAGTVSGIPADLQPFPG
jgi:antirestriction protein ArdC